MSNYIIKLLSVHYIQIPYWFNHNSYLNSCIEFLSLSQEQIKSDVLLKLGLLSVDKLEPGRYYIFKRYLVSPNSYPIEFRNEISKTGALKTGIHGLCFSYQNIPCVSEGHKIIFCNSECSRSSYGLPCLVTDSKSRPEINSALILGSKDLRFLTYEAVGITPLGSIH